MRCSSLVSGEPSLFVLVKRVGIGVRGDVLYEVALLAIAAILGLLVTISLPSVADVSFGSLL